MDNLLLEHNSKCWLGERGLINILLTSNKFLVMSTRKHILARLSYRPLPVASGIPVDEIAPVLLNELNGENGKLIDIGSDINTVYDVHTSNVVERVKRIVRWNRYPSNSRGHCVSNSNVVEWVKWWEWKIDRCNLGSIELLSSRHRSIKRYISNIVEWVKLEQWEREHW
jgi:hypothetical protein